MIEPFVADADFTLYTGGAADVLRELPSSSVHSIVTSPPYHGQRDYGVEGQIGREQTIAEHVRALVSVFAEARRVLRDDGTLWLNYGDRYEDKQLCGLPWTIAFALRDDGWKLRRDIVWEKTNPMPESVEDRPTTAHEYVFLFSKSDLYFYDFEAVREPVTGNAHARGDGLNPKAAENTRAGGIKQNASFSVAMSGLTARRNLRSVWRIQSAPFTGAHFAVFPPDLPARCIQASTSAHGACGACGAPWSPVYEKKSPGRHELPHDHPEYRPARYVGKHDALNGGGQRYLDVVTVGWAAGCDCDDAGVVPCVVLDPFMGAGTTGCAARDLNRRSIGIELNPEYARLAADRLAQQSLLTEAIV